MRLKEYSAGLRVKKSSNQMFASSPKRQGVTVSEVPHRREGSTGYYCWVRWDRSTRDSEEAVHMLQPVPTKGEQAA